MLSAHPEAGALLILLLLAGAAAASDIRAMIIPDAVNLLILVTGLGASVILGTVELAATSTHPALVAVGIGCFVVGLGLGLVAAPSLIAAQSSVAWGERAVVTGTNMFARSVGSAVGVAVLGAVVNGMLRGQDATSNPQRFGLAVTWVFVALAATAAMLVVAGLAMPHHATVAAQGATAEPRGAGSDAVDVPEPVDVGLTRGDELARHAMVEPPRLD